MSQARRCCPCMTAGTDAARHPRERRPDLPDATSHASCGSKQQRVLPPRQREAPHRQGPWGPRCGRLRTGTASRRAAPAPPAQRLSPSCHRHRRRRARRRCRHRCCRCHGFLSRANRRQQGPWPRRSRLRPPTSPAAERTEGGPGAVPQGRPPGPPAGAAATGLPGRTSAHMPLKKALFDASSWLCTGCTAHPGGRVRGEAPRVPHQRRMSRRYRTACTHTVRALPEPTPPLPDNTLRGFVRSAAIYQARLRTAHWMTKHLTSRPSRALDLIDTAAYSPTRQRWVFEGASARLTIRRHVGSATVAPADDRR